MNDQQLAAQWAYNLLYQDNWCILDTETTGIDKQAQICQMAIVSPDGEILLDTLVRPTIPIAPEAIRIHGITDQQVIDALPFDQVFLQLLKAVSNRDVVIYNADYDLRLIRQSLRVYGINLAFPTSDRRQCRIFSNGGRIDCAMQQYAQFKGEWDEQHNNYRWQPLPGSTHRALYDCLATLRLIRHMASHFEG